MSLVIVVIVGLTITNSGRPIVFASFYNFGLGTCERLFFDHFCQLITFKTIYLIKIVFNIFRIPHDQWGEGSKVGEREEEEDAEEDATTTETETSTTSSALVAMKTSESSEKQQCPICGRMVSQTGLSSHIKDHEAVKCGECGAEFPNRYQKDNHKALVHDKMTFTCPHQDCSKTFFSRKLLKHHFTSVHTARHKCDLCEKSFAIKHDLHTHIRGVHEGIKVYCAFCGKDFIRPSEKNRHEKQVHGAEINKSAFF